MSSKERTTTKHSQKELISHNNTGPNSNRIQENVPGINTSTDRSSLRTTDATTMTASTDCRVLETESYEKIRKARQLEKEKLQEILATLVKAKLKQRGGDDIIPVPIMEAVAEGAETTSSSGSVPAPPHLGPLTTASTKPVLGAAAAPTSWRRKRNQLRDDAIIDDANVDDGGAGVKIVPNANDEVKQQEEEALSFWWNFYSQDVIIPYINQLSDRARGEEKADLEASVADATRKTSWRQKRNQLAVAGGDGRGAASSSSLSSGHAARSAVAKKTKTKTKKLATAPSRRKKGSTPVPSSSAVLAPVSAGARSTLAGGDPTPYFESSTPVSTPTNGDDTNDKDDSDSDSDDNSSSSSSSSTTTNNNKDGMCEYELLRLERIRRNQERLQRLGLLEFNIQPPPKKKQKRAKKKVDTSASEPRRVQPSRNTKNKLTTLEGRTRRCQRPYDRDDGNHDTVTAAQSKVIPHQLRKRGAEEQEVIHDHTTVTTTTDLKTTTDDADTAVAAAVVSRATGRPGDFNPFFDMSARDAAIVRKYLEIKRRKGEDSRKAYVDALHRNQEIRENISQLISKFMGTTTPGVGVFLGRRVVYTLENRRAWELQAYWKRVRDQAQHDHFAILDFITEYVSKFIGTKTPGVGLFLGQRLVQHLELLLVKKNKRIYEMRVEWKKNQDEACDERDVTLLSISTRVSSFLEKAHKYNGRPAVYCLEVLLEAHARRHRLLELISEHVTKFLARQDDVRSHRQLLNDNLNSIPDHKPNTRLHTLGIFFAHMIALKKVSDHTAAAAAATSNAVVAIPPGGGVAAVATNSSSSVTAAAADPSTPLGRGVTAANPSSSVVAALSVPNPVSIVPTNTASLPLPNPSIAGDDATALLVETAVQSINKGVLPTSLCKLLY